MLRVFPTPTGTHIHIRTNIHVCARAKMVGPTSHLRFKHLLPLSPLGRPPSAGPPSVAALFFRATYIYTCVCVCMYMYVRACVYTSLSVRCVYVCAYVCVTARPCIYAFVRRYLLRIGFSPLSTILCLYPVPCAPVSRIFAKKEYTLPLSLAEVDTHAHTYAVGCHRRLYLYVQSQ